MAWVVGSIGSFGKYFPNGEFYGWREDMHAFYEKMSEEDKKATDMEDRVSFTYFSNRLLRKPKADRGGVLPRCYVTQADTSKLGSLIQLASGILAVDEPFREIIEELEPNIHEFWDIEIRKKNGRVSERKFFGLRIRNYVNSFILEKSNASIGVVVPGTDIFVLHGLNKKDAAELALSADPSKGKHLWVEDNVDNLTCFMSEELQATIQDAALSIPKHYKIGTV